jgi:hypothetical protein
LVFYVAAPGGQQPNKHTDRLKTIDCPDSERAYLLNNIWLLQAVRASVQLRQARSHSCIHNCTPPVWSAAEDSSSVRYVHIHVLCSLIHRPSAASALLRNLPPASNAARKLGWRGELAPTSEQHAGRDSTHTHTHTHTNPPSASSHATILCCQLLTDSGYLHAGCGSRLARPTSYARLKHALVLAQGTPVALFQGSKSTDPPMQHIASRAADLRTIMPRHGNPKELTINLTAEDDRNAPRDRPNSSPIALEGVDLSSIDGGIGHASLPASPPASSSSPRKTSTSKSILSTFKNRSREASRERSRERALQEQQDSKDQARCMQEQEGHVPETGSMSKVYHLRKAPGSTPELSLVSSAESVAKGQNEGTQKAVITCFQMTYERWRAQGGM